MRRLLIAAAALVSVGAARPGSPGIGSVDALDAVQAAPAREAAAVVLRVEGDGEGAGGPGVGAFLPPGEMEPPEGIRLVLLLQDGEMIALGEAVELPEPDGDPDPFFRLMRAHLVGNGRPGEPPRPAPDTRNAGFEEIAALPLRPGGGRTVRALTPSLVWRAAEGAEAYRIRITTPGGETTTLEAGGDTLLIVPGESALTPGTAYEWAVVTLPDQNEGPSTRFGVASREVLDELARELRRLRERGLDPEEEGLLPAAALFRSANLPYDAWDSLDELERRGDPWSAELAAFVERLEAELGVSGPAPPDVRTGEVAGEGGTEDRR